jgi:hypothetical protein
MLHALKRHCERAVAQEQLEIDPLEVLNPAAHQPPIGGTEASSPSLARALSSHRLDAADPEQRFALTTASVAAATGEALGALMDQDEGITFVVACLRQLGLLLVAWNYPHVYARAVAQTSEDASLEQNLNSLLGFSPSTLAIAIAQRWRISPVMRASIGDEIALQMLDPATQAKAQDLRRICEAGEAFARYLNPEHFPRAEQDWEKVSAFLKAELGSTALQAIMHGVHQYVQRLNVAWPGGLPVPELLGATSEPDSQSARAERRNRYLSALAPPLREMLEYIYQTLPLNGVSRDSLDTLLKRAVPEAGFSRGLVYLLDPDSMRLTPRVGIGDVRVSQVSSVIPSAQTSEVARALQSLVPREGRISEIDGNAAETLAGALGIQQRAGVLYLEMGPHLLGMSSSQRLTVFKALRQTLSDILRLA